MQSNQSYIREEAVGSLLSVLRKLGLAAPLRHCLLPYILLVLRWIPIFEQGREPHCVITGEKIRIGTFCWVKRRTYLC